MQTTPTDPAFLDALEGLKRGDFSRLEPLFVGEVAGSGSRARVVDWHEEGRFHDEPAALAEALSCACFLGRTAVARYLLTHGVDPSGGSATGLNALHWAANRGHAEAVRLLVQWNAPLEARSMYGGNVLDTAIWSAINEQRPAHVKIVEELLNAGARPAGERWPTGHKEIDAILRGYNASHQKLDLEYEQINENFRFLADVRFKLLALVPTFGGAAVFVLTRTGLQAGGAPGSSTSELLTVVVVALFGFLATLGITLYDQRNSELYNALIHRAKHLEEAFGVPSTPGGLRKLARGGQFRERPEKHRRFLFTAGHDLGLALIYGPLLGAWLFPLVYAATRFVGTAHESALAWAAVLAAVGAVLFVRWLVVLDGHDRDLYNAAAQTDKVS